MTVKRTAKPSVTARSMCGQDLRTLEELLFQFCFGNFNLDGLIHLLCMPALVVGVVLDRGREEGVDKCSLSEARFASNLLISQHGAQHGAQYPAHREPRVYAYHDRKSSSSLRDNLVTLVR